MQNLPRVVHLFSIFILVFLLIQLCSPKPASAYFSLIQSPNTTSLSPEDVISKPQPWTDENAAFCLYDNILSAQIKQQGVPLLIPQTDLILPADIIDIDFPLYNALSNPAAPGDNLENALYANIRLNQLLDAYFEAQKKAREFIGEKPQDIAPSNLLAYSTPKHDTRVQVQQTKKSIDKIVAPVNDEFHGIIQRITTKFHKTEQADNDNHHNVAKGELAFTEFSPSQSTKITGVTNTYLKELVQFQIREAANLDTEINSQQRSSEYYEEEITLPWIIRMPLQIFQYLLSHGIEALIYGAIVIVIITVISAVRSR